MYKIFYIDQKTDKEMVKTFTNIEKLNNFVKDKLENCAVSCFDVFCFAILINGVEVATEQTYKKWFNYHKVVIC